MDEVIHIDGSQGEGGGQMVRSSLALSMVTGKPFRIESIRARRDKPGLMRQHLTAVNAAVEICGAEVEHDGIGSRTLSFRPGSVEPGEYRFSIGTAGSGTLVLQTVLPPLFVAGAESKLVIEGGTHNTWCPPFEYLERAFLPLVERMGPKVAAYLDSHGFYPAGGGRFRVHIDPCPRLAGFDLLERGEVKSRSVGAFVANLSESIAGREIAVVEEKTGWDFSVFFTKTVRSAGPGNVLLIELNCEHVTEIFTGFGQMGVSAENVAKGAVEELREYLKSDVPVGPHLADQLLLPLGISAWQPDDGSGRQRGGSFRTMPLTGHSSTHIDILRRFLGIQIDVEASTNQETAVVHVRPK